MRNYTLAILLGLNTIVTVCAPPVQAEARVYQDVSGQNSIKLDAEGLTALEVIGISFAFAESTAVPNPGDDFAFRILPPSSDPSIRGTNFTFSYDEETQAFTPLGGKLEFLGSIVFNVDTARLALPPQVEIGNLSVSYDFTSLDYFATDVNTGLRVFELLSSGSPLIDLESQTLTYEDIHVLVSQEFSDVLVSAGASTPIAGLQIAEATEERQFIEVDTTEVPEPSTTLALLIASITALAVGKQRRWV